MKQTSNLLTNLYNINDTITTGVFNRCDTRQSAAVRDVDVQNVQKCRVSVFFLVSPHAKDRQSSNMTINMQTAVGGSLKIAVQVANRLAWRLTIDGTGRN
ncbi:hypothetical protein EVAR_14281_1 [Eumeta japonica]|uniref:Uncharacterized protein n=1 Tax=Eumeta variegata TaxID=151549 RepID=A0A4C1UMQ6_EUMVA|nr:hypothetical protein EVAR_14281_1 [Eumeta japonica]